MYNILTCAHFNLLAFTCTYSICSRRQVSLEKVLPQISQMYICLLVCLYACLKSSIFDAARKSQLSQANGRSSFFLWRTWCASEKGKICMLKSIILQAFPLVHYGTTAYYSCSSMAKQNLQLQNSWN